MIKTASFGVFHIDNYYIVHTYIVLLQTKTSQIFRREVIYGNMDNKMRTMQDCIDACEKCAQMCKTCADECRKMANM